MLKATLNHPQLKNINEPQMILAQITVQPETLGQGNDSPVHMICCCDCSSSMTNPVSGVFGDIRLDMLKKALKNILPTLRPIDHISIISFNIVAEVICELGTLEHVSEINAKIDTLNAYGGTEIWTALKKSLEIIKPFERTVIVLFTDGESQTFEIDFELAKNAGKSEVPIFAAQIGQECYEGQRNCSEMARLSNGLSENLKSAEEIGPFLSQCLKTAQSNTWEHVVLKIETVGGAEIADMAKITPVLDPKPFQGPQTSHTEILGNVSAEEPCSFIMKLKVPPKTQSGEYLVAKITANYYEGSAQKTTSADIKVNFSSNAPVPALGEVDKAYIAIEAKRAEQRGDLQTTKRLYETIRDKKLADLAGKMASGIATQAQRVEFEVSSTRRARQN